MSMTDEKLVSYRGYIYMATKMCTQFKEPMTIVDSMLSECLDEIVRLKQILNYIEQNSTGVSLPHLPMLRWSFMAPDADNIEDAVMLALQVEKEKS